MADRLAIFEAMAERVRETTPARRIEVIASPTGLKLRTLPGSGHAGSAGVLGPPWMLSLPLPSRLRIHSFFESEAQSIHELLSRTVGGAWASPGATARVRVTRDEVQVWFGAKDIQSAAIVWRPFNRAELGL